MNAETNDMPEQPKGKIEDLEVKDAQVIFTHVWKELEVERGHDNLRFPKELILLGGAPGSGKGTNTKLISKARELTCEPIVVSSLLNTPEAKAIKAAGGMVGDREVTGILFRKLLEEEYRDGAILDGFPRTGVQVACLKMFVNKLNALYREHRHTDLAIHFRRPVIHVVLLFVEEKVSIERQLYRGVQIKEHNAKVESGEIEGELLELRPTDVDPEAARHRYRVFKEQTWDALQSLREIYHYHFVNAQGSFEEVEENIISELEYQSSLELDSNTFDAIRHIHLASELGYHARLELVNRLDGYELEHRALFHSVIHEIEERFMPIIERHAISGRAVVNSEDALFDDPLALAMVLDIFNERGYRSVVNVNLSEVPQKIDLQTGEITCITKRIYRFSVCFPASEIRRGSH